VVVGKSEKMIVGVLVGDDGVVVGVSVTVMETAGIT
jgi:hypothetical protein